jgi:SpoVK/Ycf46/Vps4 family AAA+-type ATPase
VTVKRGSDLRTKYWGETERNLAAMFDEARRERSILVLDEADSFLQDRSNARYSWEKSEVNELLTRMEDFEGIFLCSTNLMGDIDRAAMRRFHFKVEFRAMTMEQRCRMLRRVTGIGEEEPIPEEVRQALAEFGAITAGDFAAVAGALEILALEPAVDVVLMGLREEVFGRGRRTEGIGFLRAA